MNIGNAVKQIQKKYPSVTISRLRFLEKEGLIEPKRSKGGTREYTPKDIDKIYYQHYISLQVFRCLLGIKSFFKKLRRDAPPYWTAGSQQN